MPAQFEQLLIGKTLAGRYRIEEVLGRGGMSVVFRAIDTRLGRPVALKVVSFPSGIDDADRHDLRERLRREAAAAARIAPHPNVVHVYDYGSDPTLDLDFIAMELLEGIDLKRALRDGPIPFGAAVAIIAAVARGLAAGHRAGIVHRDVKPANIYLVGGRSFEVVKLLDFGIAKALDHSAEDDLTIIDRIPHSPAYASPEQLDPGSALAAASDVYQLGLISYELLAGERPFSPEDRERIRRGERVPIPTTGQWARIDPDIRGVIERALEPDPLLRIPDAQTFGDELHAAEEADRTMVFAPSEYSPPAGEARRSAAARASTPEDEATSAETAIAEPSVGEAPGLAPLAGDAATPPAGTRRVRVPALLLAVVLVGLIGVWLAQGRGGDTDTTALPAQNETEAEEMIRPLLVEAARNLRESTPDAGVPEAVAAVQQAIASLYASWVAGDMDRHVESYAERVDFQGDRVDRDDIRDAREDINRRFPRREIVVTQIAIEFPESGRAHAFVDRSWTFSGDENWTGKARTEMQLDQVGDRWEIVSEIDVVTYDEQMSSL